MSDYRDNTSSGGSYVGGGYRSGSTDRSGSIDPGDRSASDIEREVESTRADVAQTLGALRDKLSPGQVMDQFVDYARGSGGADLARNLGAQVRDNPLPLLLIGAGVAWLMFGQGRPAAGRYDEDDLGDRRLLSAPAGRGAFEYGAAGGYTDRTGYGPSDYDSPVSSYAAGEAYGAMPGGGTGGGVGDAAARARDAVSGAAGRVGDKASDLANRAAGAASSAADGVSDAASSAYRGVAGAASSAASGIADAASSAYRAVAGAASGAADSVGGAADAASRRARMAMHDGRDAATRYGRQAGEVVQDGWTRLVQDQPLVLGAIGLVVGAAVGAALPRTEAEDRLMGETRDDLARQARSLASEAASDVKERAGEHLGRVQQAVAGAAGTARERLDQGGLAGAVREAGGALAAAAGEVKDAVRGAVNDAADQAKGAVDRAAAKTDDATRPAAPDRDPPRPATGPVPDSTRTNPL